MVLVSPAPDSLTKSRHAFFISNLARLVGTDIATARPLRFFDGQRRPSAWEVNGCRVAISDTYLNTSTDKRSASRRTPGLFTIEYIECEPDVRGKGQASSQLAQLCKLADKWHIFLRLLPLAHEQGSMNSQALREWYHRYGFTEPDGQYLVRIP